MRVSESWYVVAFFYLYINIYILALHFHTAWHVVSSHVNVNTLVSYIRQSWEEVLTSSPHKDPDFIGIYLLLPIEVSPSYNPFGNPFSIDWAVIEGQSSSWMNVFFELHFEPFNFEQLTHIIYSNHATMSWNFSSYMLTWWNQRFGQTRGKRSSPWDLCLTYGFISRKNGWE